MTTQEFQALRYERGGAVAALTLNNPAKRNAFDSTMREELRQAIELVRADREVQQMLDAEANGQALAFATAEHRDAVSRFLDKEPPLFQWPRPHPDPLPQPYSTGDRK